MVGILKLIHKNGFVANDLRPKNISFAAKSNSVILVDFSNCTAIKKVEARVLKHKDMKDQNPTVKDDMVSLFLLFLYMLERKSFRSVVSKGCVKSKDFDLKMLDVQ